MRFSRVEAVRVPKAAVQKSVKKIRADGKVLWALPLARYVSFGDSIAAGHTIDENWETDYGTDSQYGVNGNTETAIVPGSYTALIRADLVERVGGRVSATSFARSGDRVDDLMDKLDQQGIKTTLAKADYVTVCIGANDVLEPALSHLEEYIYAGDAALAEIAAIVEGNLAVLADDTNANSYTALFNKLVSINPDATYVFTTIYNPYKYLWLEEGEDGFFSPVLDTIPDMTILGFDVDRMIKNGLLGTDVIEMLYNRVNGLCDWAEKYVTALNGVLRTKLTAYQAGHPNFLLADTKAVYDGVPDRPVPAQKHYNDLVNVEYTRGYDTAQMDWGRLWAGSNAASFWLGLATKYVSLSGVDLDGFAADLVGQIVEKVIVPDVDVHPETYGHYALKRSFADALGWESLDRHTITFQANGGSGTMAAQTVVGVDGLPAFTKLAANAFAPGTAGYYFSGWNTASDGSGTAYTNGQLVGITGDLTLYAQWSNVYTITYRHTNHTDLYGDDETGHQECYALYINGELKPKFGTFADSSPAVYAVPYGATVRVVVSNYNPTELTYDDVDCDVYWNGVSVASGYRGTEYTFTLTSNVDIDFRWKIAGSLISFNAKSWEDCYITTQ